MTAAKPSKLTYKVLCISLYTDELQELDEKVAEAKGLGVRRVSRSDFIRAAVKNYSIAGYAKDKSG